MNETNMYWDGPTGPVDASEFEDGSEPPDTGHTNSGETAEPAGSGNVHDALDDALRRVVLDDMTGTRDALARAGFTPSEANRLIFERQRPRDEGRRRN